MFRQQRAKRAAAAAAVSKIKDDVEALEMMSEAKPKNHKSAKSTAPAKGPKASNHEPSKFQIKRAKNNLKNGQGGKKNAPAEPTRKSESTATVHPAGKREVTTHEKHMRRRALREVHSNKRMRLSRRSYAKIHRDRGTGTPVYSPIQAIKLKLTPDADVSCFQQDE